MGNPKRVMEGTRLRILQLLQKNSSNTVDGLAGAMELAPATIRRHLDILQRDRLVSFREVRKKTGRPEYSFFLTEDGQESLPKDYDQLLGMMVQELAVMESNDLVGQSGEEVLHLVLRRVSERVAGEYQNRVDGEPFETRLVTLLSHLRQEDFSPETDVVDGRLKIKLLSCPFRSVALQNKSICEFDGNLISLLLNVDVEREDCIHDGAGSCTYSAALAPQDLERVAG